MTDGLVEPADLNPPSVGTRLAAERTAQGRGIEDIAAATRIPQRHLDAIEAGEFEALPSSTYALGFVRAYARVLGLDEVALAAQVREEMDLPARHVLSPSSRVTGDLPEPDRIPPTALAWTAAVLAVLLLVGYLIWRAGIDDTDELLARGESAPVEVGQVAPAPAVAAPAQGGPVVLTATDEVWLQVRDGAGETLVSRTLQPGERFAVPPAAPGPTLTVGRPEALTITVGGREVAPLGPAGRPVNDVPVTAQALLSRPQATPTPAIAPGPGA